MALPTHVKTYLAYWFQLGRGLWMPPFDHLVKPTVILSHGRYSEEFELIWRQLSEPNMALQSYLEGTTQTLGELLSASWDIQGCARCGLPVPMKVSGLPELVCPCTDMETLPDLEDLPAPREPVNDRVALQAVCSRLQAIGINVG